MGFVRNRIVSNYGDDDDDEYHDDDDNDSDGNTDDDEYQDNDYYEDKDDDKKDNTDFYDDDDDADEEADGDDDDDDEMVRNATRKAKKLQMGKSHSTPKEAFYNAAREMLLAKSKKFASKNNLILSLTYVYLTLKQTKSVKLP